MCLETKKSHRRCVCVLESWPRSTVGLWPCIWAVRETTV